MLLTLPEITLNLNYIALNNFHIILALACMMLQVLMTPSSAYLQSKPIKKDTFICGFAFFFSFIFSCIWSLCAIADFCTYLYFYYIYWDTSMELGTLFAISTRKEANYVSHWLQEHLCRFWFTEALCTSLLLWTCDHMQHNQINLQTLDKDIPVQSC